MTRPILIIEDDADISESLKYNFEREGLAAVTAPTGEAGLTAALNEREPPRLPPTATQLHIDLQKSVIGHRAWEPVRAVKSNSGCGRKTIVMGTPACEGVHVRLR